MHISPHSLCVFLYCHSIFCKYLASTTYLNMHIGTFHCITVFFCFLSLWFCCLICLALLFVLLFSSLAIITSYLYHLLLSCYPITPLYRTISPFTVIILSSLSHFNSLLDISCLVWWSFSISPTSFVFFSPFSLYLCPIPSSLRIYTTAGRRQEYSRGDTWGGESRDQSDH